MRVINMKDHSGEAPSGSVRIDRETKWGNPYRIGVHAGTREEVIAMYRSYVLAAPDLMGDLHELRGRDLACWCHPRACHGDVLMELANR